MELLIDIINNIIDIYMVFCILYSLIFIKFEMNFFKFFEILGLGTFNGLFFTYFDVGKYKFIIYLVMITVIKIETKEKIYDVIILFVSITLIISTIQVPITYLIQPLIPFELVSYLIPQVLTALSIFGVSKLPLFKIVKSMKRQILIKLLFFVVAIIYLLASHRDLYEIEMENIFYFVLLITCIAGLFSVLKRVYYYTSKYPYIYHDMANIVNGLAITTQYAKTYEEIQVVLNDFYELMDADICKFDELDLNKGNTIEKFVQEKKIKSGNQNLNIETNIKYIEDNLLMPLSSVILIIGILLDNAIEASPPKCPINVYIRIAEYYVIVRIDNYYYADQVDNIIALIHSGKSNKSIYRGYGLSNLQSIVSKYHGKLIVEKTHNWIDISVEIRN